MEAIKVEHLSKSYQGKQALKDLNLSVEQGRVFGLLGANGAGKSTSIECILGTRKQDGGAVSVLGMNPRKDRKKLFQQVGVNFRKRIIKMKGRLSLRDMNMVIFAIAMPLVVLIILGFIYGSKPAFEGAGYSFIDQSFGALCSIAICAGGLMGLPILISDYREKKILKRFKVTPVSPTMILFVHLCIYTLYSVASIASLWIVAGIFWGFRMKGSFLVFLGGWFLVLISVLSIGMLVGGIAKNSKQASVIASVLYFPMLIFSGATLPYEIMPKGVQVVANVMPLTEGIKILKAAALGQELTNVTVPIIVMSVLAAVCIICSIKCFKWE